MQNVKSIINSHNTKITSNESIHPNLKTCNCRNKEICPLNNECLSTNIIYEATLKSEIHNDKEKKYIGLCNTTFKKRYSNHKKSFNTEKYKNSTALSTEYWKVKEQNGQPTVTWKVLRKSKAYSPESKNCQLCLNEKYEIASSKEPNLLNKRSEVVSKCRHRRKFILGLYDTRD